MHFREGCPAAWAIRIFTGNKILATAISQFWGLIAYRARQQLLFTSRYIPGIPAQGIQQPEGDQRSEQQSDHAGTAFLFLRISLTVQSLPGGHGLR